MSCEVQMAVEQPTVQAPVCDEPAPAEQPSVPSEQLAEAPAVAQAAGSQPKRLAGGAFGRFLAENRSALTQECKGQPITAVTRLASERFKALSEEEKAVWQKKFQEAKEQYEKDMQAFKAAGGEVKKAEKSLKRKGRKNMDVAEGESTKKRKTDPNAPKKPVGGAFGRFLAKHRAEFQKECSGKPASAISKLAGDKWKAMAEEEKKPYQEEYEKEAALYKDAMKSYSPQQEDPGAAGPQTPVKKPRASKRAWSDRKLAAKPTAMGKATVPSLSAIHLDAGIAVEAEKAGLTNTLLKLAALSDVAACGKSQADMLKALQESNGLLHPAKRALLGA